MMKNRNQLNKTTIVDINRQGSILMEFDDDGDGDDNGGSSGFDREENDLLKSYAQHSSDNVAVGTSSILIDKNTIFQQIERNSREQKELSNKERENLVRVLADVLLTPDGKNRCLFTPKDPIFTLSGPDQKTLTAKEEKDMIMEQSDG